MSIRVRPVTEKPKSPFVTGEVLGMSASPDGSIVAMLRHGPKTTLYDVETGKVLVDSARSLSLLASRRALVGEPGKQLELVDLDGGKRLPLEKAMHWATALGDRFAWHLGDDVIEVWDLEKRKPLGTLPAPPIRAAIPGAHAPSYWATASLPDGKTLAWLDSRFTLHLFDFEAMKEVATIKVGGKELPERFELSRDGTRALAIGRKGVVVVFDLVKKEVASKKDKIFGGAPKLLGWLDDGRLVVESRFLDVIDPKTGKRRLVGSRDPNREAMNGLLALDGSHVLVLVQRMDDPKQFWSTTRFFEVWDVDTGERVASCKAESANAPLARGKGGTIFATEVGREGLGFRASWRAYAVDQGKRTGAKSSPKRKTSS